MFYHSSEHFCHCELLCLKENTMLAREICAVKLCRDFAVISICWQQVPNRCPILPNSQNSEVLKLRGSPTLIMPGWIVLGISPVVNILFMYQAVLSDSHIQIPGVLSSSSCFDIFLYSSLCKVFPTEFHPEWKTYFLVILFLI